MAQITAGETFTGSVPGKSVTPTRLNNHVNGATLAAGSISEQTNENTPVLADSVAFYDASVPDLRKATLTNFFAAQLVDQAAGTASLRTLGNTGNKAAPGASTPNLTSDNHFTGRQEIAHLGGIIASPPICLVNAVDTTGAGAGATATLSANSSDLNGQVTLSTGTTPGASVRMFRITFNKAFVTNAPTVLIVPMNQNAISAMQGTKACLVSAGTLSITIFELFSGTVALTGGGTTYIFGYICFGI